LVEAKKVFVEEDSLALIICPGCGAAKSVNVEKFKGRKSPLTVRCKKCGENFSILLDFRASVRKEVHLNGHYKKFGSDKWRRMVVKDISHRFRTGIRIVSAHDLEEGDDVKIKFTLNDTNYSEIERNAAVRWTQDRNVGLDITDNVPYESKLGFYLQSLS
jgi:uncharacterized Zn finger protein